MCIVYYNCNKDIKKEMEERSGIKEITCIEGV